MMGQMNTKLIHSLHNNCHFCLDLILEKRIFNFFHCKIDDFQVQALHYYWHEHSRVADLDHFAGSPRLACLCYRSISKTDRGMNMKFGKFVQNVV